MSAFTSPQDGSPRDVFLTIWHSGDGERLALELCWGGSLLHVLFEVLFEKALKRALAGVEIQHGALFAEDVALRARDSIARYVTRTCLKDYQDRSDEEFEGYLYVLCKRNVVWAVRACLRSTRSRHRAEVQGSQDPSLAARMPYEVFLRAVSIGEETIGKMPEPLRTVMRDYLMGVDLSETASRIAKTERRVRQLREIGIATVREAWRVDVFLCRFIRNG